MKIIKKMLGLGKDCDVVEARHVHPAAHDWHDMAPISPREQHAYAMPSPAGQPSEGDEARHVRPAAHDWHDMDPISPQEHAMPSPAGRSSFDSEDDSIGHRQEGEVNPATGLFMVSDHMDIGGNTYGSSFDSWDN